MLDSNGANTTAAAAGGPHCWPAGREKRETRRSRNTMRSCLPARVRSANGSRGLLGRAGASVRLSSRTVERAESAAARVTEPVRRPLRANRGDRRILPSRPPSPAATSGLPASGSFPRRSGATTPISGSWPIRGLPHLPGSKASSLSTGGGAARQTRLRRARHRLAQAAPAPRLHRAALRTQRPGARRRGDLRPRPRTPRLTAADGPVPCRR